VEATNAILVAIGVVGLTATIFSLLYSAINQKPKYLESSLASVILFRKEQILSYMRIYRTFNRTMSINSITSRNMKKSLEKSQSSRI